jgi:hypothetical protein
MKRKYNFNMQIFENLTKESSWVLGWILSDGCIYNNRLILNLASKDIEVLYKIKEIFEYEGPILKSVIKNNNKEFYYNSLSIYSKKLTEDLNKYEVVPAKSLILKYPKLVEWRNMRHFVRGYFEGDGCVKYSKKGNNISISFKGSFEFLRKLKFGLWGCLGIEGGIYKVKNSNIYDYVICGNISAVNFLNWIYGTSEPQIRLDRKYERSKELYKLMVENRKRPVEVALVI